MDMKLAFCGVKFGFVCSVFRVCGEFLWVGFLGAVVELALCGWHLDTTAEFGGEIWQRNLTMAKSRWC